MAGGSYNVEVKNRKFKVTQHIANHLVFSELHWTKGTSYTRSSVGHQCSVSIAFSEKPVPTLPANKGESVHRGRSNRIGTYGFRTRKTSFLDHRLVVPPV